MPSEKFNGRSKSQYSCKFTITNKIGLIPASMDRVKNRDKLLWRHWKHASISGIGHVLLPVCNKGEATPDFGAAEGSWQSLVICLRMQAYLLWPAVQPSTYSLPLHSYPYPYIVQVSNIKHFTHKISSVNEFTLKFLPL